MQSASRSTIHKHIVRLLLLLCLTAEALSSCTSAGDTRVSRLNDMAYAYHYKSLDSVRTYADSILNDKTAGRDARAEAHNNLAFFYIGKMRYSIADSILNIVDRETDNHIELCISSIQHMRLCQRRSRNKAFYEYRQDALSHLKRIHEEDGYTVRQRKRIMYAESEFRLVSSVYEYYVGRTGDAIASLKELDSIGINRQDTAQTLAYLYNIGAGGILTHGTRDEIAYLEYDYLIRCYSLATEMGYTYWQANSLQAIAEHMLDDRGQYMHDNPSMSRYINIDNVPDSLLAGNIAERSLRLFREYGDVYQQAASWRVLSRCYGELGDFPGSVFSLQQALRVDTALHQAPALMASIYELFSMAHSALDHKAESDRYRNEYLDLYEDTRQDRQLEARADQLNQKIIRMRILLFVIIALFVLLVVVLLVLIIRRHRRSAGEPRKRGALHTLQEEYKIQLDNLDEEIEQLDEDCAVAELQTARQEEQYAENRARMHLITSLIPLLDRLLHETRSLAGREESEEQRAARRTYIREIVTGINAGNNFLTRWIQLRQGTLSLHIETFRLQELFDIVSSGTSSFSDNGLTLSVEPTGLSIKADKTLTLFMLNTICDNARKHTAPGGLVTVGARRHDETMIEISVSDNGQGMTPQQQATLFDIKAITDETLTDGKTAAKSRSHGFGLANCKGIIEKYKKTNTLFAKCSIGVESVPGEGTRIFFRLPDGIRRALSLIAAVMLSTLSYATSQSTSPVNIISNAYADSIYHANIAGAYEDAIHYARKYMYELNKEYSKLRPASRDTIMLYDPLSTVPAEARWIADSVNAPYNTLLSVRNEVAVAALALHDWHLYHYNNAAYSQLFRILSADNTLEEYCKRMETAETNSNIAIILLAVMLLSLLPIYYFAYYRYVILDVMTAIKRLKSDIEARRAQREELTTRLRKLRFEHDRLHVANNVLANSFSAIKHETMYYPSRISQLLDNGDDRTLHEVAQYYRTIYGALASQALYNSTRQLKPDTLRDIMLRTIARMTRQRKADIRPSRHEAPYVMYEFDIDNTGPQTDDKTINMRLLTQVVRDLGELYNLRRCGIVVKENHVTVTTPEK
ncbi:MAG: DUF5112 domain-containing protein [Prevotella sp.]